MSDRTNVADLFAELVEREGIEYVFTVPGGTVVPLLEALSRRAVRLIVHKDEAGAGYAADGYAWASGKPGVVLTIGGPGATNAFTALAASRVQGHPLILVSGEVKSDAMGRRPAQDSSDLGLDVLSMSRAATALSVSVSAAAKAPQALSEAFRRASRLRQPVHISIPLDVQRARIPRTVLAPHALPAPLGGCDGDSARRAALLLNSARRPAILAGSGARGATRELRALAEALAAPVATTCSAKGIFPETHPLALGVFSFGGTARARRVLTDSGVDVLCAIGTGLGEFATMNYSPSLAPSRALVQIDANPAAFDRSYESFPVLGDARAAIRVVLDELSRLPPSARCDAWPPPEPSTQAHSCARSASPRQKIQPAELMDALQRGLPSEACVVADIGTSCLFVAHHLHVVPPQRCFIPMAWSCMGHPLAASIGIRLGSNLPTVCVAGDAAFLSKGLELHAAVEAKVGGLVWIVLSNGGHGLVRMGMAKLLGPRHRVEDGSFRVAPDAAALARAVGALGERVEHGEDLEGALAEGFAADRPMVLDVLVDPEAEPPMADRIQDCAATARAPASAR